MKGLHTNRNSESDFIRNALYGSMSGIGDIFIAVAFFTDSDVIETMTKQGCHVRLIVRLGFPTSPTALRKVAKNPSVEIRYFTDQSFHPKLYVFGDKVALVGSANLTTAALLTNQEIAVSIDSEDARFAELSALFASYWGEARVLTQDEIEKYDKIYKSHSASMVAVDRAEQEIEDQIGRTTFANIDRGRHRISKESVFIDTYRKSYQESTTAFHKVRNVYEAIGRRKANEDSIPLRLEIDSFFSFARETYAVKETWREQPKGWNNASEEKLRSHIREWHDTDWWHFSHTIVETNYPLIRSTFSSSDSIQSSSIDKVVSALTVLHSFHDRLRFFEGGLESLQEAFMTKNSSGDIRKTLTYLLFGPGDIVKRMCDAIYDSSYKLSEFGPANVQELVGWVNNEDLPVVNGRTTKVLRFYGFDVAQV